MVIQFAYALPDFDFRRHDDALYRRFRNYGKQSPYFASLISGAPLVGHWLRAHEDADKLTDYMTGRGLQWSDVQYPFGAASQMLPEIHRWSAIRYSRNRRRRRRYGKKYY